MVTQVWRSKNLERLMEIHDREKLERQLGAPPGWATFKDYNDWRINDLLAEVNKQRTGRLEAIELLDRSREIIDRAHEGWMKALNSWAGAAGYKERI